MDIFLNFFQTMFGVSHDTATLLLAATAIGVIILVILTKRAFEHEI